MALIDYFTIVAQIINFVVLIFLLKHFLYGPVIKAMDNREQKIATRLKDAEEKRREAEQEEASYRRMLQEQAAEHDMMTARATEEAEALKADLIKKAREEVDKSQEDWYETILRQKNAFLADIAAQAGREVYAVSRRALGDLADEELERRIMETFLKRLENMDVRDKDKLKRFYEALKQKGEQKVTIKSTFPIPDDISAKIEEILQQQTGSIVKMQYEIDPNLISGIELRSNDVLVSWSIESYLVDLENELSEAIIQRTDLQRTDLQRTDLQKADLQKTEKQNAG